MRVILPLAIFLLLGSVTAKDNRDLRIENRRAEFEARKEQRQASIAARREEIKTRIAVIRDEKKRALVERIEKNLNQINQRRTDHFLKVLERLREILAKIESRTDRAQTNGKNVSNVRSAITTAETAIEAAEKAVNAQTDKVYEVTVSDESTARNDIGTTMKKLQEDLRATRDFVHKARTAVFDALRALVAVVGKEGGEL